MEDPVSKREDIDDQGMFIPLDTDAEIGRKSESKKSWAMDYVAKAYPTLPSWVLDSENGGMLPEEFLTMSDEEKRSLASGNAPAQQIEHWED